MHPNTMIRADGNLILLVHLLVEQVADEPIIACVPNLRRMTATEQRAVPWQRSTDHRAVTCPLCQVTAAYLTAEHRLQSPVGATTQSPCGTSVIHFAYHDATEGVAAPLLLACRVENATIPLGLGPVQQTNDTRAVTCLACQQAPAYIQRRDDLASAIGSGRLRT